MNASRRNSATWGRKSNASATIPTAKSQRNKLVEFWHVVLRHKAHFHAAIDRGAIPLRDQFRLFDPGFESVVAGLKGAAPQPGRKIIKPQPRQQDKTAERERVFVKIA